MSMKRLFFAISLILTSFVVCAQTADNKVSISKEQVVSQMNYCINSITNVVHYKSMPLLEHEIDQLLNNLTMEQVVGLYEVQSFRSEMIEKISALQITEEEKEMMKRVQEMKRENLLYQSISNSLNPTMLLTGGGNNSKQLAFMAIITVARTAVEYKSASNEADIEELQAMWKYRKEDLKNFAELRKDALELVYSLFQKYGLNESDRLTEATSTLLSQIIAEEDPHARVRKLLDNKSTFEGMADFYYYLGMAYIDAGNYQEGKQYLDKYVYMYQKAPIFRYDEKSGCVALSKLALDKDLSPAEVLRLVNVAIENLPNNGPAIIQSVLILNDIGEKERAFNLLRSGIDNDLVSDKDALVMLATKLLSEIKQYPQILKQITAAIDHCDGLRINSYIPFVVNSGQTDYWDVLSKFIQINNDDEIIIDAKFRADLSSIIVQKEQHLNNLVKIYPCRINYSNSISEKTIKRKFKSLKSNPEQIFIFFDSVSGDSDYKVKTNLDYQKVADGDYPGMSRPYIPAKERKKLAKYCRKVNEESDGRNKIIIKNDKRYSKTSSFAGYADYLLSAGLNTSFEYSDYTENNVSVEYGGCKIKSRKNVFNTYPPLKNYPQDIVRIILPGVDTTLLCFSHDKDFSLYSVSTNGTEFFKEPYTVDEVYNTDIDKNKKEGWFKRLLRKRMKLGEKVCKSVLPESLDDDIENLYSSYTVTGGVWKSIFKKDTSKVHKAEMQEVDQCNDSLPQKEEKSNSKNFFQRIWDAICFWKN